MKKKMYVLAAFIFLANCFNYSFAQITESPVPLNATIVKPPPMMKNMVPSMVTVNASGSGCDIMFINKTTAKKAETTVPAFRYYVSSFDNSMYALPTIPGLDLVPFVNTLRTRTKSNQCNEGVIKNVAARFAEVGADDAGRILPFENGGFSLPADVADGEYQLTITWNWEGVNGELISCETTFAAIIITGNYHAINTKGTGAQNG